jgi:hypothetical protein
MRVLPERRTGHMFLKADFIERTSKTPSLPRVCVNAM